MLSLTRLAKHRSVLYKFRIMSGAAPLVDVTDDAGVAILTLQRAPVNSLNLDLLQAISNSLDEVAKNKPRGIILTSAFPTVFSAGLDLTELFKPDIKRLEQFWTTLQDAWIKLFGFKFATTAAINGYTPAGGCLLAMCCEYRVMVSGKYNIGINDTALGIGVPHFVINSMCHTIGTRNTELALTAAKLFTVDEALKVGLIDETATDKADAIDKCRKFINQFDRIPPLPRTVTKLRIRQEALSHMQRTREQDTTAFLATLQNPEMQEELEMYIQRLKAKKTK